LRINNKKIKEGKEVFFKKRKQNWGFDPFGVMMMCALQLHSILMLLTHELAFDAFQFTLTVPAHTVDILFTNLN
jgi:hypothetical protein